MSQKVDNLSTDFTLSPWQLITANNLKEVHDLLVDVFQNTYHKDFEDEWMGVNHNLDVELRGLKLVDGWVSGFILTPWMLANIFVPVIEVPDITIDKDWLAEIRVEQEYVVIGPLKELRLAGKLQKAYLNFDQRIGHYLIQPLVQIMDKYKDNETAFSAWSEVIKFRQEFYEEKLAQEKALSKLGNNEQTEEKGVSSRRKLLSSWQ